jgi:hypothetical protein
LGEIKHAFYGNYASYNRTIQKKEITNVMCRPHQDNNIHTPYYVNVPTKRHQ